MQHIDTADIEQDAWLHASKALLDSSNIICITKEGYKTRDQNPLIWFGTNLAQFLASNGHTEVCPLFGAHIHNIDDFAYQLCRTIPWGFEMGRNLHAVYDVVLNFTTQPKNRYFIWHDAQHLFRKDRQLFEGIFESLIVASYLNSRGLATHDYQVNQKVLFLFDDTSEGEVAELCGKRYYTTEDHYILHHQALVVVK
jgi:hypothetical protein